MQTLVRVSSSYNFFNFKNQYGSVQLETFLLSKMILYLN